MADTSDFKNGLFLEFRDDIYTIVQFQHVKPGKGGAFVRTKLKSLTNGKVVDHTFSAGEKVELAHVQRRPYQYLYNDDSGYHFMHKETFDQVTLNKEMVENADLYKEGQEVEMMYDASTDTPLTCELPPFVILEITYTEPGVKGNTASTSSLKKAVLETGAEVFVPLFVETGEKIKVDTRDRSYVERVK